MRYHLHNRYRPFVFSEPPRRLHPLWRVGGKYDYRDFVKGEGDKETPNSGHGKRYSAETFPISVVEDSILLSPLRRVRA